MKTMQQLEELFKQARAEDSAAAQTETEAAHLDAENAKMREASGHVGSTDRLVLFLYLLARDEAPVGSIETLIDSATQTIDGDPIFTNGWLARWAIYAAQRLRDRNLATATPAEAAAEGVIPPIMDAESFLKRQRRPDRPTGVAQASAKASSLENGEPREPAGEPVAGIYWNRVGGSMVAAVATGDALYELEIVGCHGGFHWTGRRIARNGVQQRTNHHVDCASWRDAALEAARWVEAWRPRDEVEYRVAAGIRWQRRNAYLYAAKVENAGWSCGVQIVFRRGGWHWSADVYREKCRDRFVRGEAFQDFGAAADDVAAWIAERGR